MQVGRAVAILTTVVSLTVASALVVSAGGCSGSSGPGAAPAGSDEEGQKLLQERMKENKAGKNPMQIPKQTLPFPTKKK
jgi:hypothetical protein